MSGPSLRILLLIYFPCALLQLPSVIESRFDGLFQVALIQNWMPAAEKHIGHKIMKYPQKQNLSLVYMTLDYRSNSLDACWLLKHNINVNNLVPEIQEMYLFYLLLFYGGYKPIVVGKQNAKQQIKSFGQTDLEQNNNMTNEITNMEVSNNYSIRTANQTKWIIFVVLAVAEAAMAQTQTVYTEATPEQLEQLQQQGIQYDVITFTDE